MFVNGNIEKKGYASTYYVLYRTFAKSSLPLSRSQWDEKLCRYVLRKD